MQRNVVTSNLNPHSDYPICRLQVVDYTSSNGRNEVPATTNESTDTGPTVDRVQTHTSKDQTTSVAETIASMHRRATELLERLNERRKRSGGYSRRRNTNLNRTHSVQETYRSQSDGLQFTANTYSYLDSGGSIHGPMDQKHSTRLGNISRSGQLIPGSRYYLMDGASRMRTTRRQSDSVAWDVRSESAFRGRTYSESRRPYSTERTSDSTARYVVQSHRPHQYRTTASHHVTAVSPPVHMSRWSSMQTAGSHGPVSGTGSSQRYATTVTRHHIKRHPEPVEMLVKHAPSASASRVDLVSIENRRGTTPPLPAYSPHGFSYSHFESETERERHLQEELRSARRELQELKRARSLTGEHDLLSPSGMKQNWKSTSTQYLNEGSWTTHTLKKNDGLPCGARIAVTPHRAVSQSNISGRDGLGRQQWASDMNIRTTTNYKQAPMHSTYSAHRENLQRKEEQRKLADDGLSGRYLEETKPGGGAEVFEEVETITLQPIGRGVHDLEPTGSIARSYRGNTPTVPRSGTPGFDASDGYRTIGTTNMHREVTSGGQYTPYSGTNEFGTATRSSELRYRSMQPTDHHYRATTVPPNYAGSTSGASAYGDAVDMDRGLMRQVQETLNEWYLPEKTRDEVTQLLRDREPGSFIIRNSMSCKNGFSLGMKAPPYPSQASSNPDYAKSGQVKHFLIGTVPLLDGRGDGVQLGGFNGQPIFPSLAAFVNHHCLHPGPLPCVLRLPVGFFATNHVRDAIRYTNPAGGGGIMADMLYLGCVPVDRLENAAAVRMAVTHILGLHALNPNGLPKRCEVVISATARDGISFSDRGKRIVTEHIKPSKIIFCGMDPENRTYMDKQLESRGTTHARTFGIVIRKKHIVLRENFVHVFSELDPKQSALTLVNYIKQAYLG